MASVPERAHGGSLLRWICPVSTGHSSSAGAG